MPQKHTPLVIKTGSPISAPPRSEADKLMDLLSPSSMQDINPTFPIAIKAPLPRRHSISAIQYGKGDNFETNFSHNSEIQSSHHEADSERINQLDPILRNLPPHQPQWQFLQLAKDKARDSLRASRSLPASSFADLLAKEKDQDYIGSPKRTEEIDAGIYLSNKFLRDRAFGGFSKEPFDVITPPISPTPTSPLLPPENLATRFDETSQNSQGFTPNYLDPAHLSMLQSAQLESSYPTSRESFTLTAQIGDGLTMSCPWSTSSLPASPPTPGLLPRKSVSAPPNVSTSPISEGKPLSPKNQGSSL